MTVEVSFRVSELLRGDDPPERRHALALQRARIDEDRARATFLALAGRRRVSVHAVDFVEFDSDNADVALAYFAIDYSGEELNGQEDYTDGEA